MEAKILEYTAAPVAAVSKVGGAAASATGVDFVGRQLSGGARATAEVLKVSTIREQLYEALRLVMCGDEEPMVTRFLALMRTRRAASICVGMSRWPGELLTRPGFVRAETAPPPGGTFWPNLLKPAWRLRFNYLLGLLLTTLLFLFWTVPVSAVQALSSLSNLATVPALSWLQDVIVGIGPDMTATISGYLSSSVLQFFLYLTLACGLFQWLARMRAPSARRRSHAAPSHACSYSSSFWSSSARPSPPSRFDSVQEIPQNPLDLPNLLAQRLPNQSTFFMHYILSGILYVSLFETTQLFLLLVLLLCEKPWAKSPDSDPPPRYDAQVRRQRVTTTYAKLYLICAIWLTFLFISPIVGPLSFVYFIPSLLDLRHAISAGGWEAGG